MTDTTGSNTGLLFSKSSTVWPAVVLCALSLLYLLLRVPNPELFLASDDQGYQMALGMAVATGRHPGFDFITQYGPFVAYSSWLAWAVSGSVIGEILLCAFGYSAAIALTYAYLARHANVLIGLAGALLALALFPRFYKWYYWLLPILTMVAAERFASLRAMRSASRDRAAWFWLAGVGASVGASGLFRYDLLLEGVVFGAIVIAAVEFTRPGPPIQHWRAALRDTAAFVAFCLVAPIVFLTLVGMLRGPHQVVLVLQSIVDGTSDTVAHYLIAPYRFSGANPFSAANILALLQVAVPLIYLGALILSLAILRAPKGDRRAEGVPLLCASLMGLGIFPQALHRADLEHLLQVIPPFVITLGLLLHLFLERDPIGARKSGGFAAFALALALLLPMAARAGSDLGSPSRNPIAVWERLVGLPQAAANNAIADMAVAIQRFTPPDTTVFLVMPQTKMSLLYFARRHQPGLFPTYEVGMFAGPRWLAENEARLRSTPPDYLVLARPGALPMTGMPAPFIPDLLAEWQQEYRRVVYQNPYFFLLSRAQ